MSRNMTALPLELKTELQLARRNTTYLTWSNNSEIVLNLTLEEPDINYLVYSMEIPTFRSAYPNVIEP